MHPFFNMHSAASAISFGIPGFFSPGMLSPSVTLEGSLATLSFYATRVKQQEALRASLRRALEMLPENAKLAPNVRRLAAISTRGEVVLVHFTSRHDTGSSDAKDYEFSRATVLDLREGGHGGVRDAIATEAWRKASKSATLLR